MLCLLVAAMLTQLSAVQVTRSSEERHARGLRTQTGTPEAMTALANRVPGEYRPLLVVISTSLETSPLVIDLLRDRDTLPRLRRVHQAFGEALRTQQVSRESTH